MLIFISNLSIRGLHDYGIAACFFCLQCCKCLLKKERDFWCQLAGQFSPSCLTGQCLLIICESKMEREKFGKLAATLMGSGIVILFVNSTSEDYDCILRRKRREWSVCLDWPDLANGARRPGIGRLQLEFGQLALAF